MNIFLFNFVIFLDKMFIKCIIIYENVDIVFKEEKFVFKYFKKMCFFEMIIKNFMIIYIN